MKTTTIQSALFALVCAATGSAGARGLGAGSIFSRVDDQAKRVTEAYAAIHEGFYGVGKERTLLKAALDVRPDGTPNITLDRAAGTAQFTIRLSVNDSAYNAWNADAHRRIEAVGMSVQFSDFEDPEARVIGGKPYRFGDNEESAIRRWEKSDAPKRAELVVRVDFMKADGNVAKRYDLPIKAFKRLGFDTYPLPLHNLNRLKDLSGSRFKWGKTEDSYANFTLTGLTDDFLNVVADVRCTVIDDAILVPEREEVARIARERTAREARERAAREAREREEAARIARERAAREARERAEREEAARIARERAEREARERAEKEMQTIQKVDNKKLYAIVKFDDAALDELIGSDRNGALPPHEMLVVRPAQGEGGKDEFVGKIRLRQWMPKTNLVTADILPDWQQGPEGIKEGDVVRPD